jgi:hypothetical protein
MPRASEAAAALLLPGRPAQDLEMAGVHTRSEDRASPGEYVRAQSDDLLVSAALSPQVLEKRFLRRARLFDREPPTSRRNLVPPSYLHAPPRSRRASPACCEAAPARHATLSPSISSPNERSRSHRMSAEAFVEALGQTECRASRGRGPMRKQDFSACRVGGLTGTRSGCSARRDGHAKGEEDTRLRDVAGNYGCGWASECLASSEGRRRLLHPPKLGAADIDCANLDDRRLDARTGRRCLLSEW